MGILIHPKRWSRKPLGEVRINWGHPLARGVSVLIPFHEGAGTPRNLVGRFPAMSEVGSPGWKASQAGLVKNFGTTGSYCDLGLASKYLATDRVTILLIRRKTDTTLRASAAFGVTGIIDSQRCGTHLPYSDGVIYWDFGLSSSPNRLTWSGYSVSTLPEFWSFVAGPGGSSIWLNGIKRSSQGSALTRTTASETFTINYGQVATVGDLQDVAFFAIYKTVLSASLLNWWAAEPYAMLVPTVKRTYFLASAAPVLASGQPNVCVATF